MQTITLTARQSAALDAGALESWDDICILAQQQADEWGEPCVILDCDGSTLATRNPSPLCRDCCENPTLPDSRYCWPCSQEHSYTASLARTAPLGDGQDETDNP